MIGLLSGIYEKCLGHKYYGVKKMKIQCENESCKKDIYIDEKITCPICKQTQKKKLMIKPLIAGATLALITGIGGYKTGNELAKPRYPVNVEYSIIDTCVNGNRQAHSLTNINYIRKSCINAFSKAMAEVTYEDYKVDKANFLQVFKHNIIN